MKILVCISNVPDTTTKVKFTEDKTNFDSNGVQWVINPWDELALTRAMELLEDNSNPINEVDVVNVGTAYTEPTIRKCLAIGAGKAFRIDTDPKDAYQTAIQIAEFVKTNPYDILICGIDSSDYNESSVGGMLAEILDIPSISAVSDLQLNGEQIRIGRDVARGKEVVETELPAVLISHKGFTKVPRIPNMRGIMMARKKPLEVIPAIEVDSLLEFQSFEMPPAKSVVKLIDAENVSELVHLLRTEAKAF